VIRRAGLVLLLIGLSACVGLQGSDGDGPECWPRFPYQQGWLGGDGAYSVPLSPTRSLWLFGDTFVGDPDQTDRVGAKLVHNSVAVSTCRAGERFALDYVWGHGEDGEPRAFLEHTESGWWWLFGGFVHEGSLYVGLLEVESAAPRGPLGLPFRFTGTALARIDAPETDPRSWRPVLLPLSRSDHALPVGTLVSHGEYLYLFTFLDPGDFRTRRVLTRLPLARLAGGGDLEPALETLHEDGVWRAGFSPEQAKVLMEDPATEMSVEYHAELGRWIALYNYPDLRGDFPETPPADGVYLRSAERLEGPWSERTLVFRIPELALEPGAETDPNIGCYAAKEHPAFSPPGGLTFTYVCNLFTGAGQDPYAILSRLQRRMDLYLPLAATITLPR
jgi:hypothetical protein